MKTPKCDKCGKRFKFGNINGLPVMVGFVLENGDTINICHECLTKLGSMSDEEKAVFFKELDYED